MCEPITGSVLAMSALAGVSAYGVYSQQQAAAKGLEAQKQSSKQALDAAQKQADAALAANNKGKEPDLAGLISSNQSAKGGASGTLLTGAQGVDPSTLMLGRTTLLGS